MGSSSPQTETDGNAAASASSSTAALVGSHTTPAGADVASAGIGCSNPDRQGSDEAAKSAPPSEEGRSGKAGGGARMWDEGKAPLPEIFTAGMVILAAPTDNLLECRRTKRLSAGVRGGCRCRDQREFRSIEYPPSGGRGRPVFWGSAKLVRVDAIRTDAAVQHAVGNGRPLLPPASVGGVGSENSRS